MKTFKDIEIKNHPMIPGGRIGQMDVGDGFTLSIVQGQGLYQDGDTFEVAVFDEKNEGEQLMIAPDDTIRSWQTVDEIDDLLQVIQLNPDNLRRQSELRRQARDDY